MIFAIHDGGFHVVTLYTTKRLHPFEGAAVKSFCRKCCTKSFRPPFLKGGGVMGQRPMAFSPMGRSVSACSQEKQCSPVLLESGFYPAERLLHRQTSLPDRERTKILRIHDERSAASRQCHRNSEGFHMFCSVTYLVCIL